jgi:hypothetical protein
MACASHKVHGSSVSCSFTACPALLPAVLAMQLADACSSAEEQQGHVAAARQEVNAVLAGRERRCQELRAEVRASWGGDSTAEQHKLSRQSVAAAQRVLQASTCLQLIALTSMLLTINTIIAATWSRVCNCCMTSKTPKTVGSTQCTACCRS